MSGAQVWISLIVAWVVVGLIVGVIMGRRGHHTILWMTLGAAFGPLTLPLATQAVRDARTSRSRELSAGSAGTGTIDVLVGIDGSAHSEAAVRATVRLLGNRIGRLTLAGVIDYDSMGSIPPWYNEARALELLERLQSSVRDPNPGTTVLVGQPATALMKEAVEGGYDLLAVGRRGAGASKRLIGSTASRLAHGADVPVLIV